MAKKPDHPAPATVPIRTPKSLTLSEVKLAIAYLETGNATEAARRAGIKSTNDDALGARARKTLGKVRVREFLRKARAEALDAESVTPQKIAQGLAHAAFADRTGIFDEHGAVRNPGEWPEELRSLILSFDLRVSTEGKTGTKVQRLKVKFANPIDALKSLATWRSMVGPHAIADGGAMCGGGGVTIVLEAADGSRMDGNECERLESASGPK